MAAYYLIITDHGRSALSAAQAGTAPFDIAQLVLGDANGQPYLPQSRANATALLNPRAAVDVERVQVIGEMVEVSAIVESNIGGFNIHEIGLTDGSGQLLYLGNYHGGYKPVLTEGAGGDLELVLQLATSHLADVVITVDGNTVRATRAWVQEHFVDKSTFNAHVDQNNLEHQNLANAILATAQLAQDNLDGHQEDLNAHLYQLATADHLQDSGIDLPIVQRNNGTRSQLQIKYGQVLVDSGETVNFSSPFDHAGLLILANQTGSTGSLHQVSTSNPSQNGFTLYHSHSNPIAIAYIAIGY